MNIDEGYIKYEMDWSPGPEPDPEATRLLNRWREPLFRAGLIGHYDELDVGFGNLSVRSAKAGQFVISGTQTGHIATTGGAHYALVTGYDIEENRVSCLGPVQASSEAMTHAALYELSDDIHAVVHVHSKALWTRYRGTLPTTRDDVAYGTPAMAREFMRLGRDTDFLSAGIAVMAGHEEGLIGIGRSLERAATRVLDLAGQGRLRRG